MPVGGAAALAAWRACALALGACGDTLQDRPIAHNTLETLLVAPYPVYWLGRSFQGLAITEAKHDPSGAFSVQYGDCVRGRAEHVRAARCASSPRPTTASSPAATPPSDPRGCAA